MSGPAPTPELARLVEFLGEQNVRELIRTFLGEYPILLDELTRTDATTQQRIVHSLKANARVIGANPLSELLAHVEQRLRLEPGSLLATDEVTKLSVGFEEVAPALRRFVGTEQAAG